MILEGRVASVRTVPAGTDTIELTASGVNILVLDDVFPFNADGGRVSVEGDEYTYTSVDFDNNTMSLATNTVREYEESSSVDVVPAGISKLAIVETDGGDEPPEVLVTSKFADRLPEGIRAGDAREVVWISDENGRWEISDLGEEIPNISGRYVDIAPEDLPPPTDNLPPQGAPGIEVMEGIGAFYVRIVPPVNADPMTYEIHVSSSDGFTAIPGNPETMYTETSSYSATVRNLPKLDPDTGAPIQFEYTIDDQEEGNVDRPYYFRAIARDADGPGPESAQAVGRLYQISGGDIRVKTIRGENIIGETLTGDLFDALLVLASKITTGAQDDDGNIVGARVELGPDGLTIYDSMNNLILQFPLDDANEAFVRSKMQMLSADVMDNFSMYGVNNIIAEGGALKLASGVVPPTSPPQVSLFWDSVQLNTQTAVPPHVASDGYNLGTFALNPSQIRGLAWSQYDSCWLVVQERGNGMRLWRFNANGSIKVNDFSGRYWVDDFNGATKPSVTSWSQYAEGTTFSYVKNNEWFIWGRTVSGGTAINKIPSSWWVDDNSRPPAIAFDVPSQCYMLVQNQGGGSGVIHVRRFHLSSLNGGAPSQIGSPVTFEAGSGTVQAVNGAVFGRQVNSAADRYAVNTDSYQTVYVANSSGALMDDAGSIEQWLKPGASLGFCHDGNQFCSVDSAGRITKYTDWTWTDDQRLFQVGISAFDSTAGDGDTANPHSGQTAGQHETPVGTLASITLPRRSKVLVTVPETNDSGGPNDADKWRVYAVRAAANPAANTMKLAGTLGSPSQPQTLTISAPPTGAAPPGGRAGQPGSINNFPGGTPAEVSSSKSDNNGPIILLRGDGAGRAGPSRWDKDGKDLDDTGWITATMQNGWAHSADSFGSVQYRRVKDTLYLRGRATIGTGNANTIFTLPVGFRPGRAQLLSALVSAATTGNAAPNAHSHAIANSARRLDVSTAGAVSLTGSPEATWVSFAGIMFDLAA